MPYNKTFVSRTRFFPRIAGLITLIIVYREGDIVKQAMKKGSFVPKNVPGVGWGGVGWGGWVMKGWGGS